MGNELMFTIIPLIFVALVSFYFGIIKERHKVALDIRVKAYGDYLRYIKESDLCNQRDINKGVFAGISSLDEKKINAETNILLVGSYQVVKALKELKDNESGNQENVCLLADLVNAMRKDLLAMPFSFRKLSYYNVCVLLLGSRDRVKEYDIMNVARQKNTNV